MNKLALSLTCEYIVILVATKLLSPVMYPPATFVLYSISIFGLSEKHLK